LRVESVAWISERKDVLSGLFFMLLLLAYERYARRGGAGRYLAVAVLLALGLAAKPMLVTAPIVLLVLDYWPLGRLRFGGDRVAGMRTPGAVLAEKLPLLALSAASGLLTLAAQRLEGAVRPLELITPSMRAANALISYAAYLGTAAWPAGLAVYYPHPVGGISWAKAAGAALLLAAVTTVVSVVRRTLPHLTAGWCWYVAMLIPVIGIVQVGQQSMADRYTYLPMIGPAISVAWLAAALARKRGAAGTAAATAVGMVLLVSFAALTLRQAAYWRDSERLFLRALAVTKDNWLIHNNLSILLKERGRAAEALLHLQESLRIVPTQRAEVYNDMGNALAALGRRQEAIEYYRMAVTLRPDKASSRYNFALTLSALGRTAEAETAYREAIRLLPDFPAAHTDLGRLLASLGRRAEAEAMYREAIRLDPEYALAHMNLGVLLARGGRFREAEACFREAARLQPELTEHQVNLGFALMSQMRYGEAEAVYREAIRREPESYPAHAGLGRVLAALGRREEAAAHFREALRLNPGAEETKRDLNALTAR
jgi:tetratricopeptide (TPR) repeat protein